MIDLTQLPRWARAAAVGCAATVTAGVSVLSIAAAIIVGGVLGFVLLLTNVDVPGDGQ